MKLQSYPWVRWVVFAFALEIIAVAINFFYAPINIAAGGSTGLAILAHAVFGWDRALTLFIINLLMVILAACYLKKKVVKNIALGSLLLPVALAITPSFKVTPNDFLAVVYGGALLGVGVALLYRLDASSGGTTVLPLILKERFYLNANISLLLIDMSIIALNLFVDGMSAFLLAAISQLITTLTMQYTEAGLDRKYQLQIMSNTHFNDIMKMLQTEYSSLTLYDVTGAYSHTARQQILLVVDTSDYGRLLVAIHRIDPNAFIIASRVMKVHGGTWGL
ncbi:MAG: YitT family protein [Lactobacillus sp.]